MLESKPSESAKKAKKEEVIIITSNHKDDTSPSKPQTSPQKSEIDRHPNETSMLHSSSSSTVGQLAQSQNQLYPPGRVSSMPANLSSTQSSAPPHPHPYDPFKAPPSLPQEYQQQSSASPNLPPYDFGYPRVSTSVPTDQQAQRQVSQQPAHVSATSTEPQQRGRDAVHFQGEEDAEPPIIEGEDASDGRMLLVESSAAARRREGGVHGHANDPHDDVTEHYRGASSGIPSLHALRHHSDDAPANGHRRPRAYSSSASHLRPGQIDYYAGPSHDYRRNVVGYGDSLRTQEDERGVFVEDEREHFTLPPIRLLSSGDGLNSPNFPVHVPKGLFDRLIS